EDAHPRSFGMAKERRALGPRRVHDRPNVIHALLERWIAGDAIGEPGTALVERDHARERCKSRHAARHARVFPRRLDVRYPTLHVDKVERPASEDLICDAHVPTA